MKTKSLILVASFAFISLITVPAFGQLRGAVGSTLGATRRASGKSGGMRGDLGLNQTLNGSAVGGDRGLGVDTISVSDASADVSRQGTKTPDPRPAIGDATANSKARASAVSGKTIETGNEVGSASSEEVKSARGEVAQAVSSTQVSTSGQGSAQADTKTSGGSKSASSDASVSRTLSSSVAGKNVSTGADADSHASVKSQKQSDRSNGSKTAADSSNSSNAKLHGLERAESRASNKTAWEAIDKNEQRQTSINSSSGTKASVKAKHQPKQ